MSKDIKLYVPQSSVEDYYSKWTGFNNILPIKNNDPIELPINEISISMNDKYVLDFDKWSIDKSNILLLHLSNPKIASYYGMNGSVNNYVIEPLSIGECFLDIYNVYGLKSSYPLTVTPAIVESMSLTPTEWNGTEGDTFQIMALLLPENATDKTLEWSSSDELVATVDNNGLVSVLKEGTCIITAKTTDGSGISAECIVTSTAGIDDIFVDEAERFDIYNM